MLNTHKDEDLAIFSFFDADNYEKNHDYCPTWDYDVLQKSKYEYFEKLVEECGRRVFNSIEDDYKINFDIFLFQENNERAGVYISGTSSYPMIGLDVEIFQDATKNTPKDLVAFVNYENVINTIVHELAHAFQEQNNLEEYEDEAESVVEHFVKTNSISFAKIAERAHRENALDDYDEAVLAP